MPMWRVLSIPVYLRYWLGDLAAGTFDQLIQVAILWYLAKYGHSAYALGWYVFSTEAPVVIGGPFVALLFRKLHVRAVMVIDFAIRSASYGFLAFTLLVAPAQQVAWWKFDVVASINAIVFMATSAGGPNLWQRLVPSSGMDQVIQAEQIGWNVAALLGPFGAGLLTNFIGLPAIVASTAVIFGAAAINLGTLRLRSGAGDSPSKAERVGFTEAWSRVLGEPALLVTTGVFWIANLVSGFQAVLWPLIVRLFWHGSASLYGALLTAGSVGGLVGSITLAGWKGSGSLLRRVLACEFTAGVLMLLFLPGLTAPLWGFAAMFMTAAIGAATATWVLQLRFKLIEEAERPSILAYIRTALHTAAPVGGLLAGMLWHLAWTPALLAGCVAAATIPNAIGLLVSHSGREASARVSSR